MTVIKLNEVEKLIAYTIAKERYASNRKLNIADQVIKVNDDRLAPDIAGAESELAMSKLLGLYPVELFDVRVRSAKMGHDLGDIEYKDKIIDVKATVYQNGRLVSKTKNENIDLFILMTGKDGEYTCRGGITAEDLYKPENFGNNGGKFERDCYFVDQSKLTDYKKLLDIA
jgi:hypothetical protein